MYNDVKDLRNRIGVWKRKAQVKAAPYKRSGGEGYERAELFDEHEIMLIDFFANKTLPLATSVRYSSF